MSVKLFMVNEIFIINEIENFFKASASFDGTVAVWDRKSGQVSMLQNCFSSRLVVAAGTKIS